ncbi:hypothetical protein HB777_37365 (plasmid) [Mesorhizobium loti]|nr:hypothetical protein HB777_37365 [Mesorhizobium loti]
MADKNAPVYVFSNAGKQRKVFARNQVVSDLQGERAAGRRAAGPADQGRHASGHRSTDVLLRFDQEPIRFDTPRLISSMRGTGCMLASAIAAHLANARSLQDSVREGKLFVFEKLRKHAAENSE